MKRVRSLRFIDTLRLHVRGGNGGLGLPRVGGVGGRGGDVYVEGKKDHSLMNVHKTQIDKRWSAGDGGNSHKHRICGESGEDVTIAVPLGTTVWLEDRKKVLGEINQESDRLLVAQGGLGGNPNNQFNGQKGMRHNIKLELKLLADVGLVGFPNAGKSTLLRAISRAKPKIASYPFTTLRPTLGMAEYSDGRQVTIADLPGLIEGAWANMGMGHKFLRHVERTRLLLFVVDINGFQLSPRHPHRSSSESVMMLNRELELYKPDLLSKPALLMVNKMDSPNADSKLQDLFANLEKMNEFSLQFPEEYRPEREVKFEDVILCSAKSDPSSIQHLKERLRVFIDLAEEVEDKEHQRESDVIKKIQLRLQQKSLKLL